MAKKKRTKKKEKKISLKCSNNCNVSGQQKIFSNKLLYRLFKPDCKNYCVNGHYLFEHQVQEKTALLFIQTYVCCDLCAGAFKLYFLPFTM